MQTIGFTIAVVASTVAFCTNLYFVNEGAVLNEKVQMLETEVVRCNGFRDGVLTVK